MTDKNIRCYILAELKGGVKSQLVQVSAKETLNYEALTKTLKVESMKNIVSGVKFKVLKAFACTKKLELWPCVTLSFSPIYPKQISPNIWWWVVMIRKLPLKRMNENGMEMAKKTAWSWQTSESYKGHDLKDKHPARALSSLLQRGSLELSVCFSVPWKIGIAISEFMLAFCQKREIKSSEW